MTGILDLSTETQGFLIFESESYKTKIGTSTIMGNIRKSLILPEAMLWFEDEIYTTDIMPLRFFAISVFRLAENFIEEHTHELIHS